MRTGKPFLIGGVPIAGLALHSFNCGTASAWTPLPATSTTRARRPLHRRPSVTGLALPPLGPARTAASLSTPTTLSSSTDIDLESLRLTPELRMMTEAFSSISDEKTRHKQLLHMASKLPAVDDAVRVPRNKVPGCLSTVHVDCVVEKKGGDEDGGGWVVNYFGDSDGLLTKGLLALLVRGLSGCTAEQIEAVDPSFVRAAGISHTLTPGRNNGFLNMLEVMKRKATEAMDRERHRGLDAGDATANGDVTGTIVGGDTNGDDGSNCASAAEESSDIVMSFVPLDGKPIYNDILSTLIPVLKPTSIRLIDNSSQHAGHSGSKGWEENGESHFLLEIVADAFEGLNLVKRHKLVYMLLAEVMPKIHTLEIQVKSSSEVE